MNTVFIKASQRGGWFEPQKRPREKKKKREKEDIKRIRLTAKES